MSRLRAECDSLHTHTRARGRTHARTHARTDTHTHTHTHTHIHTWRHQSQCTTEMLTVSVNQTSRSTSFRPSVRFWFKGTQGQFNMNAARVSAPTDLVWTSGGAVPGDADVASQFERLASGRWRCRRCGGEVAQLKSAKNHLKHTCGSSGKKYKCRWVRGAGRRILAPIL